MAAKSSYEKVIQEHRLRLERLAERRGVMQVKGLYDEATAEVKRKLDALVRGKRGDTYSAHLNRVVLAQLQTGQIDIASRMLGELVDVTKEAQVDSIHGLTSDIRKLGKLYKGAEFVVPIDEAARLRDLVGKRAEQLEGMHAKSLASWGAATFDKVHEKLSLSLAVGETTGDAIDRLLDEDGGLDLEWWRAERIVRTESAFAANAAHADGIAAATEFVPEMRMRWVEHVDDTTGMPLDDRVGDDSIAMHGQVARPGGVFTMPATLPDGTSSPSSLVGESWAFPPNRPNDRSVVHPWFPGMGVIAWELRGGRRVKLA